MSLLATPAAASIATSRSRADNGAARATWTVAARNSPGVAAPSQAAASSIERRSAAVAARRSPARLKASAAPAIASAASSIAAPRGGAMAGPGGNERRVARVGQFAQPGGGVLPAGAHQVVQQPRLGGPVPGGSSVRGGVSQPLRRLGGPSRRHGGPRVGELLFGSAEAEGRPGGAVGQRPGGSVGVGEHGLRQGQARQGDAL